MFDSGHCDSLRDSEVNLPPERPGCFAEQRFAGQADVLEDVVIKLAQLWTWYCSVYGAAEMGRSAARFNAEICSTFAQNRCGVMGICCRDPIRIGHVKASLP